MAERVHDWTFGLAVGMTAAVFAGVVALTTRDGWYGVAVLSVLAVFLFFVTWLLQDRLVASDLPGLEVEWRPNQWKSRTVKVIRVELEEPEYAFVELDGEVKTAPLTELTLSLTQRLKYSWRRK